MKWPWSESSSIKLVSGIPVAEIEGNRPGKTLVVTGGMDGDEYAGMEAAYRLIETYREGNFAGRLIVIPIVNMSGFQGECSWNPEDMRFPKHIYPGDRNGSPTAKLVDWLVSNYVDRANVWHDMHAGSITEGLHPFVWLYQTGVVDIDAFAGQAIRSMPADLFVYERASAQTKAGQLARRGCAYILTESGERGRREETDVARHLVWVRQTMRQIGMIESEPARRAGDPVVLHSVVYDRAPMDGLWRPVPMTPTVRRGQVLGVSSRLDGTGTSEVRASSDGTPLWWKETMKMKRDELLIAIGF